MESVADQIDHLADAFVCEKIAYNYDIMFESLQRTRIRLE